MDNTGNNQNESFNDPINWKSLGFFSAEEYLIYVFKKVEKITAAVYLVSGLLKDDEPLKWELRDRGMDLLSSSLSASSSVPGDRGMVIQSLFSAALETISLLNVAKISSLISEMNHSLLVHEIDLVLGMLRDRLAQSAENAGYVLSESFFKTPDLFSTGFRSEKDANLRLGSMDRAGKDVQRTAWGVQNTANKQAVGKGQVDVAEKKHKRQGSIVALLKGHPHLTIKDFVKVITDCSEKTIQRELLELVEKGLIKKEGERRWSRYSLS